MNHLWKEKKNVNNNEIERSKENKKKEVLMQNSITICSIKYVKCHVGKFL